jgi:hypothetical protein
MQLLVILIAIPMIRLLYRLVLVETGLGSIAYDRISHVLRNPLADVTLLVIAIVAVVTIMTELVTLFVSITPPRRRRDLVPARAAPGLGNDQEAAPPATPASSRGPTQPSMCDTRSRGKCVQQFGRHDRKDCVMT